MNFKEVEPKPNFPELEHRVIDFWERKKIREKYLQKNGKAQDRFSFLDGPITANNPMGVHHAWGRMLKDLYQRFKNMQGFKQRFQNGFDNQGLWVEVEVEKKMGFKSKKDIEEYGIAKFVEKCKEHTLHFAQVQIEQSKRLGYFMDWGNDYYTMSDENNYAIWHFLKTCWQNSWLYKGEDVVPWCPRCGTAISQHEILTGDYVELTHKAVYVKYPLKNKENEYLLVWTTTPWTLPANVAIAVNPEIVYSRIKTKQGDVLILAKARLSVIKEEYEVLEEFEGKKLVGSVYMGAFDELPIVDENIKKHLVVDWKEGVMETEGTGLVHMSTGSGPEDYDRGKELDLPVFSVLDENGNYVFGYGFLEGKSAQEVGPEIITELKKRRFLYKEEDFTHRYPLCWRCKSELLFRLVDEWYISMDELRHRMMEVAKKIHWIPEFGLKMELDWLRNMDDWLISKKRYWGLSLPIWECECGHFEVIGSKEELKERAVEGWEQFEVHSPHRPWTDMVKIKCSKCGKKASRIPDVGNPWLDAGIVPFSTLRYFEDKAYWEKWFPADLVLECFPGQFKNWFYSLIAMSTVLENTNPFKTLVGHALVRDEKGREMHKSWGNAIEFNEAAEKMGADVMRWLYSRQNTVINLNFGYGPAEEIKRKFFFILWNCYRFFTEFANLDQITFDQPVDLKKEKLNILDKWILSRINNLVVKVTDHLDQYESYKAALAIEEFVADLSLWYIRRSRDRVGPTAPNGLDKALFYETTRYVFSVLMRLMAPFVPFTTESIWQNLNLGESVHLQDWPQIEKDLLDKDLEKKMEMARQICSLARSARKEVGLKTRQPLEELRVHNPLGDLGEELSQLIAAEVNVKHVSFIERVEPRKGWVLKRENDVIISLKKEITPELKKEGMIREVVRQIQQMRKEAGYKPNHRIFIGIKGNEELNDLLLKNKQSITKETIAEDLDVVEKKDKDFDLNKQVRINDQELWLAIKKL